MNDLDVRTVSITANTPEQTRAAARELGLTIPHLSDQDTKASQAYGVLRWAMPHGGPGHTFVLVDKKGVVRWIRDYGARSNGGRMYVPLDELYKEVSGRLQGGS